MKYRSSKSNFSKIVNTKREREKEYSNYIDMLMTQGTDAIFGVDMHGQRNWTEFRLGLHNQIIDKLLKGLTTDISPLAIFMGGGSGSGKSIIRDSIVKLMVKPDILTIDPDEIKKQLPEFSLFQFRKSAAAASLVHSESKHVANRLIEEALNYNYSFVYDTTMAAPAREFLRLIDKCKKRNYRLVAVVVTIPVEIAIKRANIRFHKTKRNVPEESIRYTHEHFPKTFFQIREQFDIVQIYDNSVDGQTPTLVAEEVDSGLEVLNDVVYNEFKE